MNTPFYDLVIKYSKQINENLNGYIKGNQQWNLHNHKCYCFVYKFINFDNIILPPEITNDPSHFSDIVVTNKMVVDILNGEVLMPTSTNHIQLQEMILNKDLLAKIFESIPQSFDARPRFKCFYFKFPEDFITHFLLAEGVDSHEQLCNNAIISKVRTNDF